MTSRPSTCPGSAEALEVTVDDGKLVADHAFWLFGPSFLVLRYRMHRRDS